MGAEFPIKLSRRARRMYIDAPGSPGEGDFGVLFSGVRMPRDGSFYVVEFDPYKFDPGKETAVRIMAYADKYGRVFASDVPVDIPPARTPSVQLVADHDGATARVEVAQNDGSFRSVATLSCSNPNVSLPRRLFSFTSVTWPYPVEFRVPASLPYASALCIAYLSFFAFAPDAPESASGGAPFNVRKVFARLSTSDVFAAVNKEVLEAEASWEEHPDVNYGLERFLVHMLRESGAVGRTASDMSIALSDLTGECDDAPDCATSAADAFSALGLGGEGAGSRGGAGIAQVELGNHLVRTARYANTYFITFSYTFAGRTFEDGAFVTHPATRHARRMMLAAESALNRFLAVVRYLEERSLGSPIGGEGSCEALDEHLTDCICEQAPDPSHVGERFGRWDTRLRFARAIERLRLPYRVSYRFRGDVANTVLGVELLCPDADNMPAEKLDAWADAYVARNAASRREQAARYAAHVAILAGACGFSAGANIERVCVTCLRDDCAQSPVLSVIFGRQAFLEAFAADAEHRFENPFTTLDAFDARMDVGDDFRLGVVEPLFVFDEGELAYTPADCEENVTFPPDVQKRLGIAGTSDLQHIESTERAHRATEVAEALEESVDAALACLKDIHDRSEDVTLRRVCVGLMSDFESGKLVEQSSLEVYAAFTDAYGFASPLAYATQLMQENDPAAVGVLEEVLASAASIPALADTKRVCHRCFDDYECRALYALRCPDDAAGRSVALMPDEVYYAHHMLAYLLADAPSTSDDALSHAQRCVELAPSSALSHLRLAYVYSKRGEWALEVEASKHALSVAYSSDNAGLAFYMMACAYWRLDRYELAAVCYYRCFSLGCDTGPQALLKLKELLSSVRGITRMTDHEEDALLKKEGIDAGALRENAKFLRNVAAAAIDAGAVPLGCSLSLSSMRVLYDDAQAAAIASLVDALAAHQDA